MHLTLKNEVALSPEKNLDLQKIKLHEFKEYFNLSLKDTLKTWSLMETIVSVVGLIGVFVLNFFIH